MKKNVFLYVCLSLIICIRVESTEVDVYFNAATEKYLQGDYALAVENLEKALEIDPQNSQIKNFLQKIIIEAGTQYNMKRRYNEAMTYLKKGKKMFPDNPQINELHNITNQILSPPEKEKYEPSLRKKKEIEQPRTIRKMEELKKQRTKYETIPKSEQIKRQKTAVRKKRKTPETLKTPKTSKTPLRTYRPETSKRQVVSPAPAVAGDVQKFMYRTEKLMSLLPWALCILVTVVCIVLVIYIKKASKKRISELNSALSKSEEEKSKLENELSLEKQRDKLEKGVTESVQKELALLKLELKQDMRDNYEQRLSDVARKKKVNLPEIKNEVKEIYVQKQKDKIESLLADIGSAAENIYVTDPKIEQIRQRIIIMAQNVYDESPKIALEFLKNTAKDDSATMRSNIVGALARIAIPETLDILLELHNDEDEQVKREVIKWLKRLSNQIEKNELRVSEDHKYRINELLKQEYEKGEWII